jgi:hypothetical protein
VLAIFASVAADLGVIPQPAAKRIAAG